MWNDAFFRHIKNKKATYVKTLALYQFFISNIRAKLRKIQSKMIQNTITFDWYIRSRPNKSDDTYNRFYFKICQDLHDVIKQVDQQYKVGLQNVHWKELAFTFSGYFEDVVNKIGYWKAVVQSHYEMYGQRIPFFSRERLDQWEKQYKDIHPADIHYQLLVYFVHLQKHTIGFHLPEPAFFSSLRDVVINYLDAIEEIQTTHFYEEYLQRDQEYWDFFKKARIFCFKGYLTGYMEERLCKIDMQNYLIDNFVALKGKFSGMSYEQALHSFEVPESLYAELDRRILSDNSMLSGLFPFDIFIDAIRTSAEEKAELKRLKDTNISGIFELRDVGECLLFKHGGTNETYEVSKESMAEDIVVPQSRYVRTRLNLWKGEYLVIDYIKAEEQVNEYTLPVAIAAEETEFFRHDPTYRAKYLNLFSVSYHCAVEHFEDHLIRFDNKKTLLPVLNEYLVKEHQLHKRLGLTRTEKPFVFRDDDFQDDFEDIGLLLTVDRPMTFTEGTGKIIAFFDKERSFYDYVKKRIFLTSPYPVSLYMSLWQRYIEEKPVDSEVAIRGKADLEAVLRIYNPYKFNKLPLPDLSLSEIEHANLL